MTAQELAEKFEWEGGVIGGLEYGLSPDDLNDNDPELKQIFEELYAKWIELEPLVEKLYEHLPTMEDE